MPGEEAAIGLVLEAVKGAFCFFCSRAEYFDDLQTHIEILKDETLRLKEMKQHIETRVDSEKKAQMRPVYKVTDWVNTATRLLEDAEEILKEALEEIDNKASRWLCPKKCCLYNRVGKRVSEMLQKVSELIKEGHFDVVVVRRLGALVDEKAIPETVGLDLKLEEIWGKIEDPSVTTIGLYGIGGVGKTTLLKKVYNKLSNKKESVVIWVDVSREDNEVEIVQKAICKKFKISMMEENIDMIWKLLRGNKCVLMLDNLGQQWDYHLLQEVGVPMAGNENGKLCKVIFTTRSKEVCDKMRAISIELECLPPGTARELFQLYVGQDILKEDSEMRKLANAAADACKGLPLLLVTISRAMASKTNLRYWKKEVEKLNAHPAKATNVEARVLPVLKVSYDALSSRTLQKCFLYFSLFPNAQNITKEKLIELWIAEGFLERFSAIDLHEYDAREEGEDIVSSLKLASLLQMGESKDFFRMHDAIYTMALWLACEEGKTDDKVLVQQTALEFSKWITAERISLWGSPIESIPETPSCYHLTTLLLTATKLKILPDRFFRSMPSLRVLDLSDNRYLSYLPLSIGELSNLHYLNLYGTHIYSLPPGLHNLKLLQILIISKIQDIPRGLISSFSSLLVFRTLFLFSEDDQLSILEEFEQLEYLNEIGIVLSFPTSVQKVLDNPKLRRCIKELEFRYTSQRICLRRMERIERFALFDSRSLMEMKLDNENEEESQQEISNYSVKLTEQKYFHNLRFVSVSSCGIKNLTWLIHAPNLQTLEVFACDDIVEIISGNFGEDLFSNLTYLSLRGLPTLKCIYHQALQFSSLVTLLVEDCPDLWELPFDLNSAKNLKKIRAQTSWWNKLQWASNAIEEAFSLKFHEQMKIQIGFKLRNIYDDRSRDTALEILREMNGVVEVFMINQDENEVGVIGYEISMPSLKAMLRNRMGPIELTSLSIV